MKILLACQQSPQTYAIPAYGFWRPYFVEGLREAGHEIIEVPGADWARGLLPLTATELKRWRDETWSLTLATVRKIGNIDLFLGYLYPQQIEVAAVNALRATGIPAVNFFCDNVREYRRLPEAFAPFDLHWVPELAALALYAVRGWPALFAPMPCWVHPARRSTPAREEQPAITFVGRRDPLRAELLSSLACDGLPLAIYGRGWMHDAQPAPVPRPTWSARLSDWADYYRRQGLVPTWRRLTSRQPNPSAQDLFDFSPWVHPSPLDAAYLEILAQSAVTLGINRYPDPSGAQGTPPTYSRLRDIEAPMLGACYLTEWAPELPQLYDLGVEIETYRTSDELSAKARILLADTPRRNALRRAGQHRALAQHTVGSTLENIARFLGLADRERST